MTSPGVKQGQLEVTARLSEVPAKKAQKTKDPVTKYGTIDDLCFRNSGSNLSHFFCKGLDCSWWVIATPI